MVAHRAMDWTFVYLMLGLKLPLIALLWIVWWAVRSEPDKGTEESQDDEGGTKRPRHPRHPRFPPNPRTRGPHGCPSPPAPPRTRAPRPVHARGRKLGA